MNGKGHGQLRRSQVITTFGPGALIDLPNDSAIVGGLDTWGSETSLESIDEPRLSAKLMSMTGVPGPRLYAPPPEPESWQDRQRGIGAWRFPEWFVVQESGAGPGAGARSSSRSRRMVPRTALTNGRYEKQPVVATRFVRACSKGHVDDIDWYQFVHGPDDPCRRRLWLDERGTSGDLVEQIVRCECGRSRRMHEAVDFASFPLGVCRGARPWLGRHANEECREPSRLLIRTASNAWFPQVVSVLSLPDRGSEVDQAVGVLWDRLQIVKDANALAVMKNFPDVANGLASFSDQEVLDAIAARISGGAAGDRPIKHAELDALLAVPEGYGDDAPIDPDFHARRLPEYVWRHSARLDSIEAVIQVHRLREVLALAGFTRLEPVMPNVDGEYDGEVERASIALEPAWFPAVENRGEGILVQLRADAVTAWLDRDPVRQRLDELIAGHNAWAGQRKSERTFPGGPYVLLHTLAHLLIQSLSMRCGYPAASIRERIFVDEASSRSERNVPKASSRSERNVPKASSRSERNVPKASSRSERNVPKASSRSERNVPKASSRSERNVPKASSRSERNVPKASSRSERNVPKASSRSERNVPKASSRSERNVPKASSRSERNVPKASSRSERNVPKASSRSERNVPKASSRSERNVPKASSRSERNVPKASSRSERNVPKASSRSERNVPEASACSERHIPRASAPSERNSNDRRYALLLYTASPDAEGTLGGLVQEARRIEDHLQYALRTAALCSNDPVCAEHIPGRSMEERWLHGAACHGCTLIAETSCEMRNEYLDRALAVPTLYAPGAAFFGAP